jgi:hypothetical protein
MSRAVRAPGLDRAPLSGTPNVNFRPGNGAGGVFAGFMQGATPKYSINAGPRQDLWRNTMARMFVRVDASEMNTFLGSIADSHTRRNLANRIAGDPSPQQPDRETGGAGQTDASVRRNTNVQTTGYLDFFIQNVQMPLQEKMQVSETLSDNYVAYAFGQSPPVWNFSGTLINSVQDDQASNMFRLYTQILRATQMARRQKSLSLSFDSYVVNGVMISSSMALAANNELMVPFSFQLLIKRVFITNYTAGWVPTRANTPFAADLNAIAYDGRPREETALTRITARIPNGTSEVTPTPQTQADPRTTLASGVGDGTAPPRFTSTNMNFLNQSVVQTLADENRPSPLLPNAPPRPLAEQASVQNPTRPETVNASGVSQNPNVSPGTPATNALFSSTPTWSAP